GAMNRNPAICAIRNFDTRFIGFCKVAYGTDSGVSIHGTNAQEAVLMHEAGMTEMDVIVSATVNSADLLDKTSSLGTIEVGKQADIIATDQSPLDNIEALLSVGFVMKGGKVYKQ
ncbi:MAG: amidohydrolase family protein, partial [Gammaproteobacteria bacterium]